MLNYSQEMRGDCRNEKVCVDMLFYNRHEKRIL
jgi:hypothetical protein